MVISDGYENSSKHFSIPQLRELVDSVQKTKDWTISYMGCDENYLKEVAKQTGVALANMAVWSNKNVALHDQATKAQAVKLGNFYKGRARGMKATDNLYSPAQDFCADWSKEDDDSFPPLNNPYVPPVNQDVDVKVESSTSDGTASPFQSSQPVNFD